MIQSIELSRTDYETPIFEIAEFGIVGDIFTVVPEIIEAVKELQAKR